ncbi:helix-turn-helix domain-containing protein [Ellagibacter isourolithinifaciens]
MKVGEKIQRIRKERGYTADQLAEMLGISAVSLRKYEYGERTPKDPMIAEIARCLEVNPSSLKSD